MDRVEVWCTGRKSHGRLELGVVEERQGERKPQQLKSAPAQWPAGSQLMHEDGVDAMPDTSTKRALVVRDDFDGRTRWVFTCPKCVTPGRQGRLMRGETFDELFDGLISLDQRGFDVSLLPR